MGRGFELIVILGCPRSGTTWLHGMLAEHRDAAGLGETYLFTHYVAPLRRAYEHRPSPRAGLDRLLDPEAFQASVRLFASDALGRIAAARPGVRALIDKTPGNALVWREIRELFPDALLVHVIRDPRDVVASLRAAGRSWGRSWAPTGAAGAAELWRRYVDSALEVESEPRRIVVRYERLLAETAGELARVCAAAGLPVDADWCRDTATRHSFDRRTRTRPSGPEHSLRRGLEGSWREDLGRGEVRIVEHIAGRLMDRLSYPRSTEASARRPLGLAVRDLFRGLGQGVGRRARLLFRRSLGLPEP